MTATLYSLANASTLAADVAAEMARAGMAPNDAADLRTDGNICRFDCEGDRKGKRNAWAVIHAEGLRPVAVFGHWSRGIHETVVLGKAGAMTAAERSRAALAIEQARKARDSETRHRQAGARREANALWAGSLPPNAAHPYLAAKGIRADGLRSHGGALLVPIRDEAGSLWNVQKIQPNGCKRFLRGGKVSGCYATIGITGDHLLICEGWATGRTLHDCTGLPVAVAFSAGNLANVARILRGKYPASTLTICADNDVKPDGSNPGVTAAKAAAEAVGGLLAVPPTAGDFNDLHHAEQFGATAICEAITHDHHNDR